MAATAIGGGELPDELSPEEMAGDYSWDCEYNFDLKVSTARRILQRAGRASAGPDCAQDQAPRGRTACVVCQKPYMSYMCISRNGKPV